MTYSIYTLGCKVNLYESEYIAHLFNSRGYIEVPFGDKVDIIIINTCSVTNHSDIKSKKMIRRARKLCNILVACGCFIQTDNNIDDLGIDIVLGNKDKSKIVDFVLEYIEENKAIKKIYDLKKVEFEDMMISDFKNKRAFVKIQDGCNNFCSYCIIPYVRGGVRSKKMAEVIKEVNLLVNNGHKEIVLTGIHTGNYGRDKNTSLAKLLVELAKINELKRIRISSIEITELDKEFLNVLKENKKIVDHMHIPLQAGSNKILKIMNRKYDVNYFINKIKEIRLIRPDMNITTDVIVGHPHENDNDFKETIETIKIVGFSKVHVFPYSDRIGTKSSMMDEKVDGVTKKKRAKILEELNKELIINYNSKFINKTLPVLIEKNNMGHTPNFIDVKVLSDLNLEDKIVEVLIEELGDGIAYGRIKGN